jgi:hypothetical protein
MTFRSIPVRLLLGILLAFVLSGCITTNTSIVVNSDGSGEIITALGLPNQFTASMSARGIDPITDLRRSLSKQLGYKVSSKQWNDAAFEWLQVTRLFENVDELNDLLSNMSFVDHFHLRRVRHFLKDQFIIDAQFYFDQSSNPFMDVMGEDQSFANFNTDEPIDSKISLRLPGRIRESNGVYDPSTKTVLWETNDTNTVKIHVRSEKMNNLSLIITITLALIAIALITIIVLLLKRIRRKSKPVIEDEVVSQRLVESIQIEEEEEIGAAPETDQTPVIPPSKILAMIGARELLEQVNTHVLNNHGNISIGKGAIRLVWRDQHDEAVTRGIMITVQDADTILINGVPFPATREATRQGLISCLKGMTKQ